MTVDYLAWESDCGVGIDLSNVGDVKAALSTVVSWQKPVAWLHISANQIEMNVLDELTEIGHIEAIDFGIALPEDEIISALVSCVEIECIHVVNESMRRALVAVLNQAFRTYQVRSRFW